MASDGYNLCALLQGAEGTTADEEFYVENVAEEVGTLQRRCPGGSAPLRDSAPCAARRCV